jgi:uncharacterized protein (TIGR04255 family)
MPFPESKRVVFQQNPLVEVICQLRFPTILQIGSEEPAAFQNRVRADYPLYEKADRAGALPREISELLAQLPVPLPVQGPTHRFLTADSNRSIALGRDFLAVTEKNYKRWEGFREEVERAQRGVAEIYQPAFYSRIGLRYKDVIDRDKLGLADHQWDSLIKSFVIGVLGVAEVRDDVEGLVGQAQVRLDEVPGGFVRLRHGLIDVGPNGKKAYQIDVDCFTEERNESQDVFGVLDRFNRVAGNLFRWAITPQLHSALEPMDVQ